MKICDDKDSEFLVNRYKMRPFLFLLQEGFTYVFIILLCVHYSSHPSLRVSKEAVRQLNGLFIGKFSVLV